jgi:hypothetical protein
LICKARYSLMQTLVRLAGIAPVRAHFASRLTLRPDTGFQRAT